MCKNRLDYSGFPEEHGDGTDSGRGWTHGSGGGDGDVYGIGNYHGSGYGDGPAYDGKGIGHSNGTGDG